MITYIITFSQKIFKTTFGYGTQAQASRFIWWYIRTSHKYYTFQHCLLGSTCLVAGASSPGLPGTADKTHPCALTHYIVLIHVHTDTYSCTKI